ncbi:hypothetical protein BgiBS90_015957 [Biomphalaria glabrata]|nr:hypothetical protein BgiBS90_015957 [Biomphalaria glabrata]
MKRKGLGLKSTNKKVAALILLPSGMMEPESAKVIGSRSLGLHNFRCTKMVGDGNSKTFQMLNSLKPSVLIIKQESVIALEVEKMEVSMLKKISCGIYFERALRGCKTAKEM